MPRQPRLEYEDAIYHVINRGNYRRDVFATDGAKEAFLTALDETASKLGWKVHAWVIMSNHFHVALETPNGDLVAGMKQWQGSFATRFNRLRTERGHIFQGRYKSLLVEGEDYLGALCHYIHLNPVRAKVVATDGVVSGLGPVCTGWILPTVVRHGFTPPPPFSTRVVFRMIARGAACITNISTF